MKNVELMPKAFGQLQEWLVEDVKIAQKIMSLLDETRKTPFDGRGKPEPLKGNYSGYWSRRITQEHRLLYKVTDTTIKVYSCKSHYED